MKLLGNITIAKPVPVWIQLLAVVSLVLLGCFFSVIFFAAGELLFVIAGVLGSVPIFLGLFLIARKKTNKGWIRVLARVGLLFSLLLGLGFASVNFVDKYLFWDFSNEARINATKENHNRIRDMIVAGFAKCASGSQYIVLKTDNSGGTRNISCTESASIFSSRFVNHLNYDGFKNPYSPSKQCCYISNSNRPQLGTTFIGSSGNKILINTNVGTEGVGNRYLSASVTKE